MLTVNRNQSMRAEDIKAGDLLYAVGPGCHTPQGPTDLKLYCAIVKTVRYDGSYSASATPADFAAAVISIDLESDRPVLGFPQWSYKSYEIGDKVFRSPDDAIRAFAIAALSRATEAEKKRDRANAEAQWAIAQIDGLDL
jgi:hypothetical protein